MMVIEKKDFYFIRHGQTDYNAADVQADHPPHLKLNEQGKKQAERVRPIIHSLPIQTICVSPYQRAKETHSIISSHLGVDCYELDNLGECTFKVWDEMTKLDKDPSYTISKDTRLFLARVKDGVNEALSFPGPVLIVSHGGVYYAICSLMGIPHAKIIDNCIPVHFSYQESQWAAKKLLSSHSSYL